MDNPEVLPPFCNSFHQNAVCFNQMFDKKIMQFSSCFLYLSRKDSAATYKFGSLTKRGEDVFN